MHFGNTSGTVFEPFPAYGLTLKFYSYGKHNQEQ
jgi:hypothetical protein